MFVGFYFACCGEINHFSHSLLFFSVVAVVRVVLNSPQVTILIARSRLDRQCAVVITLYFPRTLLIYPQSLPLSVILVADVVRIGVVISVPLHRVLF